MESQNYEKIIPQRAVGKALLPRLVLILCYLAWLSICLVILLRTAFAPALLLLLPALSVILVLFTWKYVRVEYEYSIYGEDFSVAKIYGKSKRKELLSINLKQAILIAPRTEEFLEKADKLTLKSVLWTVSSPSADGIWMIVYPEDEQIYSLLFFEADEDSLRLLRRANPRATVRTK